MVVFCHATINTTEQIENAIMSIFRDNKLDITFRKINTGFCNKMQLRNFWTWNMCVIGSAAIGGYFTKDFI